MNETQRSIEIAVEVVGTPDEVWRAIATGPGISSWYVPHIVEEREGGTATASFGPGPEMQVPGRVAAWDPPHRIVFDGGDVGVGLAFEWTVEATEGGRCIVRLVNRGFSADTESDDHFDAMQKGWQLFLRNLQLHLEHFRGQDGTAMLPMATWQGPQAQAWERLAVGLGVDAQPKVGDRLEATTPGCPPFAGTVVDTAPWRIALLLDQPAAGTAFLAVEGQGDTVEVSIWSYFYGDDAAALVERDDPAWREWLSERPAL